MNPVDDPDAIFPCLSGVWVLRYYGSDHFHESVSRGVSPIAHLNGAKPGEEVGIRQLSEPAEGVIIAVDNKSKQVRERFALSKQLIVNHAEPEFLSIYSCGSNFETLTIQRYGPRRDQSSREEFAIEGDGHTMSVTLTIQLSSSKRFTIKKYFTRKTGSEVPSPVFFRGIAAVNHQVRNIQPRSLGVAFGETVEVPGEDASDTVTMFEVNMTHNFARWQVQKRYNDFTALYKFLELVGVPSLPDLPPKSIGKVRGERLEQRKAGLQAFLQELCTRNLEPYPQGKEVLLDFLQAPQHSAVHTVTDEDARRMLAGDGSRTLPFDPTRLPEIDPRDVLLDRLSTGMVILKHGRQGRPHHRILKCDLELKRLMWEPDPNSPDVGLLSRGSSRNLEGAKSDQPADSDRVLELADVIEVRKGTDPDPEKPSHTGTAILRRNCNEEQLALSFALITESRSLNIQCLSKEDFTILFPNLRQILLKNRRPAAAAAAAARNQSPAPSRSPPGVASPISNASPKTGKEDAMKAAAKILFEEKKPSSR